MPTPDASGTQPPHELVRQILDTGGFWDCKRPALRRVLNVTFAAACGLPGGGRHAVCERTKRQLTMLWLPEPALASTAAIFHAVLAAAPLGSAAAAPPEAVAAALLRISRASGELVARAQASFRPVPAQPHYVFSMHDTARLWTGMAGVRRGYAATPGLAWRLWAHEAARVLRDRLIDGAATARFDALLAEVLLAHEPSEEARAEARAAPAAPAAAAATTAASGGAPLPEAAAVLFGDFAAARDDRAYEELPAGGRLAAVLDDFLEEYNLAGGADTMRLVFFNGTPCWLPLLHLSTLPLPSHPLV